MGSELQCPPRRIPADCPGGPNARSKLPTVHSTATRLAKVVNAAVLHVISLATAALTAAWGRGATSRSSRVRKRAEADRLRTELARLEEELAIKDARWARLPARRRPHYGPVQRMRILKLRATRGWSVAQTAERFLLTEETVASWMRRVDEGGERALVQTEEPVNQSPDMVAYIVHSLKTMCPTLGRVRIAQALARAGLHLGATTVGWMLEGDLSKDDTVAEEPVSASSRTVTAKYPGHVWHVDLTQDWAGEHRWRCTEGLSPRTRSRDSSRVLIGLEEVLVLSRRQPSKASAA